LLFEELEETTTTRNVRRTVKDRIRARFQTLLIVIRLAGHLKLARRRKYARQYQNKYQKLNNEINYLTSECTWKNIKDCMQKLSETGETFSGLQRSEGGFLCTKGPGFQSTETDTQWDFGINEIEIGKSIRFQNCSRDRIQWPMLGPDVEDEYVVIPSGIIISWRFDTINCPQWSKARRLEISNVIATALRLTPTRKRGLY
jgi:hypothetical protein